MHRSLEQIAFMLDCVVRNEGQPDIVQISGGEPTIHPEFFAVLDLARQRPIKHLMLNTNGVRIAQDAEFARRLGRVQAGLRGLSPVRLARRGARNGPCEGPTWSISARRALERAQRARNLDHAGRDAQEGAQRRSGRRDHRLCTGAALRPRGDVPAGAGRRTGRGVRPGTRPADARRGPLADPRAVAALQAERHRARALPSRLPGHGLRPEARRQGRSAHPAARPDARSSRCRATRS